MKKLINSLLIIIITMSTMVMPAVAKDNITVEIDGREIIFDVQPQIINDRTMVPLRAIFEALGASVEWDQENQMVTSVKDNNIIRLTINRPYMLVNGSYVTLDTPACIIDERTLVPVRAISEAFDLNVEWDNYTRTVLISQKPHTTAFDILKSDIITQGVYNSEYSRYQIIHPSKYSDFAMISYEIGDEAITFFEINDGLDYEASMYMEICNDGSEPWFSIIAENPYGEYECTAVYKYGKWTIYSSTFPSDSANTIYELINAFTGLFDAYIQQYSDITFADFGIYYY